MSRVGKQPVALPTGVTITVDASSIVVAGPKGTLSQFTMPGIVVTQEGEFILVTRTSEDAVVRAKHGLMRALVQNMVTGVSAGFTRKLEINGVGYKAIPEGTNIRFALGFSHPVIFKIPEGISITVEQNNVLVSGISKQEVGQVAAEIRSLKKPEPYKGKGIKYAEERIVRKAGKSGKDK
jgi:large subunit ribosomal protein L6